MQTIALGKAAADNARRALISRREEIKRVLPHLQAVGDGATGNAVLAAIDGAIGAVTGIELDFADVERLADGERGGGGRESGFQESAEDDFLDHRV